MLFLSLLALSQGEPRRNVSNGTKGQRGISLANLCKMKQAPCCGLLIRALPVATESPVPIKEASFESHFQPGLPSCSMRIEGVFLISDLWKSIAAMQFQESPYSGIDLRYAISFFEGDTTICTFYADERGRVLIDHKLYDPIDKKHTWLERVLRTCYDSFFQGRCGLARALSATGTEKKGSE
jgi:hypothetical protein